MQTSTITVAVLTEPTEAQITLRKEDLEINCVRGSGAGGQHRNVTNSAVQIKHLPTGIMVRCEQERSQGLNKEMALSLLRVRLWEAAQASLLNDRANDRKAQLGSGMRGDKRRTIRVRDDIVNDHLNGKQWSFKAYSRGDW